MTRSILDVVREELGNDLSAERVDDLTLDEISELADAVERFYRGWEPPGSDIGVLRVHLGGWIGGNFAVPEASELLATMLLYADQLLLHDPLAEWFAIERPRMRALDPVRYRNGARLAGSEGHLLRSDGWLAHRDDLERNLAHLRWAIPKLRDMEPLIESGAALLVPHLQIVADAQDALLTAVRHDLRNDEFIAAVEDPVDLLPVTTDFSRGVRLELSGAGGFLADKDRRLAIAGNPSYYLNKTLAVASAAGASYLPPSATDWRLYELRLAAATEELRRATQIDLKLLAALHSAELPLLQGLDLETVSRLRVNEGVMEDWRAALRGAARTISSLPVEGAGFEQDSRQVLDDLLGPVERQVAKEAGAIARLKRGGRDASVRLVAGAAGAGAVAAVTGGAPVGLLAAGVSAVSGWTLGALLPPKRSGVAHVVAHLRQSKV